MTTSSKMEEGKFQRKGRVKMTGTVFTGSPERQTKANRESRKFEGNLSDLGVMRVLNVNERIERLRVGLEAGLIIPMSDHFQISREAIGGIIGISPATMNRKIKARALLSPAESERLDRIAQIEAEAENVFGDSEKSKKWLLTSNDALGSVPLSLLDTDIGTSEVRKVLNAIAYGGVI